MAGSFKQQCPSCEAMVLVKDPKQIGKKVDCPRCKYRFVVEEPAETKDAGGHGDADTEIKDEDKGKPKSTQAVTAKKPGAAPAAPTIRKKSGPRKGEEAEEAGAKPKKKKQQTGSSMVLILGIGMSVCAVALLGIGAYFIFLTPKEETHVRPTGRGSKRIVETTEPEKKGGPELVEITNLLPANTQGILNLNFKDLVNGAVGRAAFDTPGAFRYEFVENRFGLRAKDVDQVLIGQNFSDEWVFVAIRTGKPINAEELKKNLNLKPANDSPYRGQEYFVGEHSEWLDNLGKLLGEFYPTLKLAPPMRFGPKPCFRIVDNQTLIVADEKPIKAYMDAKGQPTPAPAPTAKGPKAPKPAPASKTYLTVNPELKTLIEQMENKKQRALVYFAWEVPAVRERMERAAGLLKPTGLVDEKLIGVVRDLRAVGASLQMGDPTVFSLGLVGNDDAFAKTTAQQFRTQAEAIGIQGAFDPTHIQVDFDGKLLAPPPTGQPLPKGANPPQPDVKVSVKTAPADKVLVVNLEFRFNVASASKVVQDFLQPHMLVLRGLTDMVGAPSRIHQLAAAVKAMVDKADSLPRGTFNRPIDAKRMGRPYPPDERVSWMAELLPYLGHDDVYKRIKFDQSWKSSQNAMPGQVLIPAFVDARYPPNTWWVQPPYLGGQHYGCTDFVGVAGVGLDAARYSADDPAVAKKLGPFGYDRATPLSAIKDGRSNTILMLQVPPRYKRPWIAGGGATVVGIPEKNSIRPFVHTYGKQRGTYAIMADGAVRFISENISDEAFKAMCTINGGEKVDLDKDATLVPVPAELKAQP